MRNEDRIYRKSVALSPWFEDRATKCRLLVFVDDATSQIMTMRFCHTETVDDYFEALKDYLLKYGRPEAFHSDKHSIFRVNLKGCERNITSFHRALKELGIELICAHSSQAKGRKGKSEWCFCRTV